LAYAGDDTEVIEHRKGRVDFPARDRLFTAERRAALEGAVRVDDIDRLQVGTGDVFENRGGRDESPAEQVGLDANLGTGGFPVGDNLPQRVNAAPGGSEGLASVIEDGKVAIREGFN